MKDLTVFEHQVFQDKFTKLEALDTQHHLEDTMTDALMGAKGKIESLCDLIKTLDSEDQAIAIDYVFIEIVRILEHIEQPDHEKYQWIQNAWFCLGVMYQNGLMTKNELVDQKLELVEHIHDHAEEEEHAIEEDEEETLADTGVEREASVAPEEKLMATTDEASIKQMLAEKQAEEDARWKAVSEDEEGLLEKAFNCFTEAYKAGNLQAIQKVLELYVDPKIDLDQELVMEVSSDLNLVDLDDAEKENVLGIVAKQERVLQYYIALIKNQTLFDVDAFETIFKGLTEKINKKIPEFSNLFVQIDRLRRYAILLENENPEAASLLRNKAFELLTTLDKFLSTYQRTEERTDEAEKNFAQLKEDLKASLNPVEELISKGGTDASQIKVVQNNLIDAINDLRSYQDRALVDGLKAKFKIIRNLYEKIDNIATNDDEALRAGRFIESIHLSAHYLRNMTDSFLPEASLSYSTDENMLKTLERFKTGCYQQAKELYKQTEDFSAKEIADLDEKIEDLAVTHESLRHDPDQSKFNEIGEEINGLEEQLWAMQDAQSNAKEALKSSIIDLVDALSSFVDSRVVVVLIGKNLSLLTQNDPWTMMAKLFEIIAKIQQQDNPSNKQLLIDTVYQHFYRTIKLNTYGAKAANKQALGNAWYGVGIMQIKKLMPSASVEGPFEQLEHLEFSTEDSDFSDELALTDANLAEERRKAIEAELLKAIEIELEEAEEAPLQLDRDKATATTEMKREEIEEDEEEEVRDHLFATFMNAAYYGNPPALAELACNFEKEAASLFSSINEAKTDNKQLSFIDVKEDEIPKAVKNALTEGNGVHNTKDWEEISTWMTQMRNAARFNSPNNVQAALRLAHFCLNQADKLYTEFSQYPGSKTVVEAGQGKLRDLATLESQARDTVTELLALQMAEEEAARKAAEEDAARKAAEEEAARKAAEEETARKAAEEETARKAAEEETARKAAEEAKADKDEEEEVDFDEDKSPVTVAAIKEAITDAVNQYKTYQQSTTAEAGPYNRGVIGGFFSYFRHGSAGLLAADTLKATIDQKNDLTDTIEALETFFTDPSRRYYTHSLASYVVDALIENKIISELTQTPNKEYTREDVMSQLESIKPPREAQPAQA